MSASSNPQLEPPVRTPSSNPLPIGGHFGLCRAIDHLFGMSKNSELARCAPLSPERANSTGRG
jgi:hypothetical protein